MAPLCTVILRSTLRCRWITKTIPASWLFPERSYQVPFVFRQIVATEIRVNVARETQCCGRREFGQTQPWEAIVALARAVFAEFGCSSIRLTSASKPASITASKRGFWDVQWDSNDDCSDLLAKRSKQFGQYLEEIPILAKTGGQFSAPGAEEVEIQKTSTALYDLPYELQLEVLRRVPLKDLSPFNTVSKSCKKCVECKKLSLRKRIDPDLLAKRSKQSGQNPEESTILAKTGGQFPAPEVEAVETQKISSGWHALPNELQSEVLQRIPVQDLFRFKKVSKSCKKCVESDKLSLWRGVDSVTESMLTAINYYIKDEAWRCSAYDLHSKSWKALKPFSFLPAPDASLFKEYSVTGHGGLMCADVSKLPQRGKLVVFNPLTGESRVLPPLLHPRIPVLVHLSVDSVQNWFKVVVAGSSTFGDMHLSKKVEVLDSSMSAWKEACDLPPAFVLNEHQSGVCLNGKLFFISFLEGDCRRGVVAFDVEKGEWLKNLVCPIPFSSFANTLQLVESDGKVYLFSEQERGCSVEHCIDELEFPDRDAGAMSCRLRNVVRVKKAGGRGLQVYPEHVCAGFGEGRLCIFNTLNRTGVVYEMRGGKQCEELQAPPADQMGENFFSLNPASFTFQPNLSHFNRT